MKINNFYHLNRFEKVFCALLAVFLTASFVVPACAGLSSGNYQISCKYPGKIIEAGETVTFDLAIKRLSGTDIPQKIRIDTFMGEEDWEFKFLAGDTEIDRLFLEQGGSDTVKLEVRTAGDNAVDTYPLRVCLDDARLWVYVIVDKTHEGEDGILKLEVVNEQGEKIKGAKISAFREKKTLPDVQVFSTADGQVRCELDQGTYRFLIENDGYLIREKDDVKIQSGYTTDAGTVMLERKNFGLDIDIKAPVVTAPIGEKPLFEIKLSNVGKSDDTFSLSSEDMPEGWYARYKEAADSKSELSEVFIGAGEEKTVFFEAIPPYSVSKGDYIFDSAIISSDGSEYTRELKATVRGSSDLQVFSEKYLYEAVKGETIDIPVKILNNGNGVALSNVRVEVSAPDGWKVSKSPETVPGIAPGKRETVFLKVVPPADIAASEYKITVKVISDQQEVSDSIRISLKESSLIGVLGIIMLLCVAGGVFYIYRKYERR